MGKETGQWPNDFDAARVIPHTELRELVEDLGQTGMADLSKVSIATVYYREDGTRIRAVNLFPGQPDFIGDKRDTSFD